MTSHICARYVWFLITMPQPCAVYIPTYINVLYRYCGVAIYVCCILTDYSIALHIICANDGYILVEHPSATANRKTEYSLVSRVYIVDCRQYRHLKVKI